MNFPDTTSYYKLRNVPLAFIAPRIRGNKRIGPFSKEVLSILVGGLLGDAHLQKLPGNSYRFRFEQSQSHKDYLFWLHRKLKNLGVASVKPVKKIIRSTGSVMYYFYTYNFSSLIFLHHDFYGTTQPFKKRIPGKGAFDYFTTEMFEELQTPQALAIWIMDDGGKQAHGLIIKTHCFTEIEVDYLCDLLFRKYNLICNKNKAGLSKFESIQMYRIRIMEDSQMALAEIIKPHKHISKEYKMKKYLY